MKVLICCNNDYANFGHDIANALRTVGVDCIDVKTNAHAFDYAEQSAVLKRQEIQDIMLFSDVVMIMHSDINMLSMAKELGKRRIIVWHTGTAYRQHAEELNDIFNTHVCKSFIALGELMGLGAYNEQYFVGCVNDIALGQYCQNKPIKFPTLAHYPSNATIKGTETIKNTIVRLYHTKANFNFKLSETKVSHQQQLKRISECDIYIELFAPMQEKKQYGSFGMTALEAAAMGKVVMTCHTTENVYEKTYGIKTPFIISNNEIDLNANLYNVVNLPSEYILQLQQKTLIWLNENHGYTATGNRLKNILNEL